MENAADALKMAGYVLLFTMALTVAILTLSKAKVASEAIVYTKDETNYYTFSEDDRINHKLMGLTSGQSAGNRIVTLDTIIPTIYRYNSENFIIQFIDNSNNTIQLIGEYKDSRGNLHTHTWNRLARVDYNQTNNPAMNIPEPEVSSIIKFLQNTYNTREFEEKLSINLLDAENENVPDSEKTEVRIITYKLRP